MKIKSGKQTLMRLALIVSTFFFVTIAFGQHTAPWTVPEAAKAKKNPFTPDASSLARGKNSYKIECLRCHGKEGRGDGPNAMKIDKTVADLSSDKIQEQADGELFWKISEGRRPM